MQYHTMRCRCKCRRRRGLENWRLKVDGGDEEAVAVRRRGKATRPWLTQPGRSKGANEVQASPARPRKETTADSSRSTHEVGSRGFRLAELAELAGRPAQEAFNLLLVWEARSGLAELSPPPPTSHGIIGVLLYRLAATGYMYPSIEAIGTTSDDGDK